MRHHLPYAAIVACATLLAVAAPAWAPRAAADPHVTLSWDGISDGSSPVLVKTFTGPGPYDVYVSLTGQSTPVQAFDAYLLIGGGDVVQCMTAPPVPPAWRFESGGCQGGRLCFEGGNLVGTDPSKLAQRAWVNDVANQSATGYETVRYAEIDPMPPAPLDPSHTYRLVHFRFDHSGTCTGEDQKVWIVLQQADWTDALGNEFTWTATPPGGITWNQPAIFGTCAFAPTDPGDLAQSKPTRQVESGFPMCDQSVPTRATSWGLVKSTYR